MIAPFLGAFFGTVFAVLAAYTLIMRWIVRQASVRTRLPAPPCDYCDQPVDIEAAVMCCDCIDALQSEAEGDDAVIFEVLDAASRWRRPDYASKEREEAEEALENAIDAYEAWRVGSLPKTEQHET